jgi:hypothetical protein
MDHQLCPEVITLVPAATTLKVTETTFRALIEQSIVGFCVVQDDRFASSTRDSRRYWGTRQMN